jgi:hypothetical protein
MLPIKTAAVCLASVGSCAPTECCSSRFSTPAHYDKIIHNYLNAWNGDLSLVNSTFAPALSLEGDILPNGAGGYSAVGELVHSAYDFEQFIRRARSNFEVYTFTLNKWAGSDHNVVGRWTLNAVIADTFVLFPTYVLTGINPPYSLRIVLQSANNKLPEHSSRATRCHTTERIFSQLIPAQG